MSERQARVDAVRLLEQAQEAVSRGDPVKMLEALAASHYLDGLTRRLQKQWGDSLPAQEVDECIARAVDAACAAAFEGREIRSLGAWLWKAARNNADDMWRRDYSRRQDVDAATLPGGPEPAVTEREAEEHRRQAEERRKDAIRIARELLPRIGYGQVVDVMEILIDAAENELPDLPAVDIAEQLDISKAAVRTLVSRGLKRLRRLAEEEGVAALMELPDTDTDKN